MTTPAPTPMPTSGIPDGQQVGLRERKKARTRAAIQDAALRLYIEQGYNATTIGQIAETAEVSQATFFRYFPTKEDTVLYDRLDPLFIESFLRQPAKLSPTAALRAAMREVLSDMGPEMLELEQTRWRLVSRVPRIRAALANQVEANATMFTDAVADRVGRPRDDVVVRMWAAALIGVILAAVLPKMDEPGIDIIALMDTALSYVEDGLPL